MVRLQTEGAIHRSLQRRNGKNLQRRNGSNQNSIVTASHTRTTGKKNPRNADRYTALTNDTGVGCRDDAVWFAPACRAAPAYRELACTRH